jgi:HEAT repeat protein
MRKLAFLLIVLAAPAAWAGRGASFGSVMDAIHTRNADVIISELERAEKLICAQCVAPVMELLDDSDYRVREVAAWWFSKRPMLQAAVTMQSLARLAGGDARQAEYAADALGTFRHPAAVPALAGALDRGYPAATKVAILRALGTIADPDGEAAVVHGLADGAPEARRAAAQAYYDLRGRRDGAALVPLLGDGDTAVRRQAAAAIGSYRQPAARLPLETLLASDPDPIVRRNAAWALVKLGDPASQDALARAASSDPVNFVRSVAKAGVR